MDGINNLFTSDLNSSVTGIPINSDVINNVFTKGIDGIIPPAFIDSNKALAPSSGLPDAFANFSKGANNSGVNTIPLLVATEIICSIVFDSNLIPLSLLNSINLLVIVSS